NHRQAAHELGDQSKLKQIFRLQIFQHFAGLAFLWPAHFGAKADGSALAALRDQLFETGERAAANEQDVRRVDLEEFLLRMLATALWWDRSDRAFHDLQERLLRALDIVVGSLQQLQDDVLDVLADIARFRQRGGVGHRERHVDDARQGLRQQGLARAGRADQQDVRLGELDVVVLGAVRQALVVVVDGDREDALRVVLADHVVVEDLANVLGARDAVARLDQGGLVLLTDDVHAELDALVADEHGGAGDQLAHLVLALAAEGAVQRVFRVATAGLGHSHSVSNRGRPDLRTYSAAHLPR